MVEGTCLENKRAGNGTEGSNPSLSATSANTTAPINFSDQVAKIILGLSLCLLFRLVNPLAKRVEAFLF